MSVMIGTQLNVNKSKPMMLKGPSGTGI